jgi:hypothetical protein
MAQFMKKMGKEMGEDFGDDLPEEMEADGTGPIESDSTDKL